MAAITLSFVGRGQADNVQVEVLGPGLFRLTEEPALYLFAEDDDEIKTFPSYGDVFEANAEKDGTYTFARIAERSKYRKATFTLSRALAESAGLASVLKQLTDSGGYWERHMGGILFTYCPEGVAIDVGATIHEFETDA